jgi:hypothetical protein
VSIFNFHDAKVGKIIEITALKAISFKISWQFQEIAICYQGQTQHLCWV